MALPPRPADPATDDPMPRPPPPFDLDACCGQDCSPCVLELQAEALERYRAELAAWQSRHGVPDQPAATPGGLPCA